MKFSILFSSLALSLMVGSTALSAQPNYGIEVVPGYSSLGVCAYTSHYGGGVWLGKSYNNAEPSSKLTLLGMWFEKRYKIQERTYLGFGIDGSIGSGKVSGVGIESKYAFGPYVGAQYYLVPNIMLSVWTNPIQYSVEKLDGEESVTTIDYFSSKLGLTYFFK